MSIAMHEHKFASTGITVFYRNVSALIAVDVRAAMAKLKPKPPVEMIELAGTMREQENEDDPDYIEAVDDWEVQVNLEINKAYVKRAKFKFDYPEWQEEVADYRATIGPELQETDEMIFLSRVAASGDELSAFFAKLTNTAGPSPEGVQAVKDSFRSELPK